MNCVVYKILYSNVPNKKWSLFWDGRSIRVVHDCQLFRGLHCGVRGCHTRGSIHGCSALDSWLRFCSFMLCLCMLCSDSWRPVKSERFGRLNGHLSCFLCGFRAAKFSFLWGEFRGNTNLYGSYGERVFACQECRRTSLQLCAPDIHILQIWRLDIVVELSLMFDHTT